MAKNDVLRRAVHCALFANAAAIAAVPAARADDAGPAAPPAAAAAAPAAAPLTEIIVTGSRIVEPGLTSISPVTTVSAAEVQSSGFSRIEDLLNTMPQVMADQGAMASNGSTGEATVDLRGLGVQRTLVLINGRRLMPGDPTSASGSAPDLNNIPAALVERVDVLTGGASSTYGADAVAGVVNFVMNDHFEGLKIDMNGSIYQHNQHNSAIEAAVTSAATKFGNGEYTNPPSSVADGASKDITIIYGKNLADGAGNFTAYAGYRTIDPVLESARDFSECTPNVGNAPFTCFGSSNGFPGRFIPLNGAGDFTIGPNGTFVPFNNAARYNFAPSNYFQRPDERWTAGEFLHLDLTDKMQVYNEFMFMRDVSVSQIAPGAAFLGQGTAVGANGLPDGAMQTNCANPFLSAQQLGLLCGGSTAGNSQFFLGRRNVEGGDRINDLEHTSFRIVVGLKGEFADGWRYDTYAMEGQTAFSDYGTGNLSKSNMTNALDVVAGPGGTPVCANAGAVGCVPWNIFALGGVTPAALNYVSIPAVETGFTEERVWDGNITGDLGKYGLKTPLATDGLLINFGGQYRSEGATLHPDAPDQNFDVSGAGGPILPLNNVGFHVWEGYLEAGMPLIQDRPFAKELSFEAGYRYSAYDLGFNTNTYKFGLNWAPSSDIRFRGSYQRAVRAPNLQELFVERGLALEGSYDPCAGSTTGFPTASLAQCMRTGVTAAQYGNILPSPAGQYQGFVGGNPALKPEQADTTSFGFVFTPSFAPGLNLTLDYFNIRILNVIGSYGFTLQLQDCLASGTPLFCSNIHRDGVGTLWASSLGYINDPTLNLGALQSRGVDLTGHYPVDLNRMGRLTFNLVGTYTAQFVSEPGGVLGAASYNCAGYYGPTCGNAQPKWKHVLSGDWETPVQGLGLELRWRYLSQVSLDELSPNPLLNTAAAPAPYNHVGGYGYIDFNASYVINKTVSVRLGINNLADKDPPYVSGLFTNPPFNNGNTYPQVYDALGRLIFANVTLSF